MIISLQYFFHNLYLMFPICDKKDFENFLILSVIVILALTILSRSILVDLVPSWNKFSLWVKYNLNCRHTYIYRSHFLHSLHQIVRMYYVILCMLSICRSEYMHIYCGFAWVIKTCFFSFPIVQQGAFERSGKWGSRGKGGK